MADQQQDIFDTVAPSAQSGGTDIFDQAAGPQAPKNPYADPSLNDMSKVPGADPGMQTPMQAGASRPNQPVEKQDIFDAIAGNGDAPASSAQQALEQRENQQAAGNITGNDPALQNQRNTLAEYFGQQQANPIESAVRAVPVAGDVAAGGYHALRGASGVAENQADLLADPKGISKEGADKVLRPATEAIGGAMDMTMPAFGVAGMVAPVKTAAAYFTAIASGYGAKQVAAKLNMSPDAQNFANVVGTFIPLAFHTVTQLQASVGTETARVPDAEGNIREVPVKTAAVGGRGFGAAVGKGEDGSIYAAGRLGKFSARAKWGGSPEGAPSPTDGNGSTPGAQPSGPVRGYLPAEAQDPTANLGVPHAPDPVQILSDQKAQTIMQVAKEASDDEQRAEAIASGQPPPPPPEVPKPEGMDDGVLSQKTSTTLAAIVNMLPEPMRPKAILESVGNLAKWMFDKKTIIDPDGKVRTLDTAQAAQKHAVDIVNGEIEKHAQALKEQQDQQKEQQDQAKEEADEARTEREDALKATPKKNATEVPDNTHTQLARRILGSLPDNTPAAKMDQALRDKILLPTPIRKALVEEEVTRRAQQQETKANEAMTGKPTPEGQQPHEIDKWVEGVKKGEEPFAHIQKDTTYKPKDVEGLTRTTVKGAKDADGIYYHDPEVSSADIRKAARNGTLDKFRDSWKQGKAAAQPTPQAGGAPAEAKPEAKNAPESKAVSTKPGELKTLYRGEVVPGTGKPTADWIKQDPKFQATMDATGRWFTSSPEEAEKYAKDFANEDQPTRITKVEIPASEAEKYKAANNPEAAKFVHSTKRGVANDEYFLPRELASQAVEHKQESPRELSPFEGAEGKKTHILLSDGSSIPARHRMVELSSLNPSHDGLTFQPSAIFPPGAQERSYDKSKAEQMKVIDHEQRFEPSYIVNTNPDATNGPPIVTSKPVTINGIEYPAGTVLGGTSRTMTLQRVYTNSAEATYREALLENHRSFGFTPEAQNQFNQPVGVREVEPPKTLEEMHRLVSLLNKPPTQSLDSFDQAVSLGKHLSPDTLNGIAEIIRHASDADSTATLNAVLGDKTTGRQIVKMLEHDGIITDTNRGSFVDPSTTLLTVAARNLLGNALLGNLLDSRELIEKTPAILKQKLLGTIGSISAITAQDDGWNIAPAMREAAKQYGELSRMPHASVQEAMSQGGMFAERGPVIDTLIKKFDQNVGEIRKAFSLFTTGADEGRHPSGMLVGLAETPDPYLDFNFAFGTELTKEQFDAEMKTLRGAVETPKDGIEQTAPEANASIAETKQPEPESNQPQGEVLAPESKPEIRPFKKGDKVEYTTNAGKQRAGEVAFADDRIVRIKDARTGTVITKKKADVQHVGEPVAAAPVEAPKPVEQVSKPADEPKEEERRNSLISFLEGRDPKNYNDLKKLVAEHDKAEPDQLRMKEAQEAYEASRASQAAQLVYSPALEATDIYERLVQMYENQPNLSIRTSTSITNQAYSTPLPLAFVADKFAGIDWDKSVYEPTAGNGNLLIAANPDRTLANELEDTRALNLAHQEFRVSRQDASKWAPDQRFDSVVANPPFGALPGPVDFEGYTINKLEHLIALKALSVLKDDGKASIIIGGSKEPGEVAAKDKPFFNYLYSHYNVIADFELSGDMYSRQGAAWPVRVLAVDGRARSAKVCPPASAIERLSTWESVYAKASEHLGPNLEGQRQADAEPAGGVRGETSGDGRGDVQVSSGPGGAVVNQPESETSPEGYTGNIGSGQPGPIVHSGGVPTAGVGSPDNVVASDGDVAGSDRLAEDQPRAKAVRREPSKLAGHSSDAPIADEDSNQFQSVYTPFSEKKDVNVLAPKAMTAAMQHAMEAVAEQIGDIDQFVADELGYSSIEEMQNAFMGLQVDTIAAAIHGIRTRGTGIIIADQTGIGKGRQAAAIIRWAELHGHIPIFQTAKAALFTDMFGDLHDIGSGNVIKPFLMNADATITHPVTGQKVFGNDDPMSETFQRILETGRLPEGKNAMFTTYSQINKPNKQQLVLNRMAPKAVFILDESHKAGGDSNTGVFMRGLLQGSRGAVYLSATWAKRADNLPLYAGKTDIGIAIPDKDLIVSAIEAGGAPLQAVVSYQLAQAGQLFRREKSFDGISFPFHIAENRKAEHEKIADSVTEVLRAIVAADGAYHDNDFADIQKDLSDAGESAMSGGNHASATVNHMEFSSIVHNLTKQMLLGLKADDVADKFIQDIKDEKKPIIALENTMGSFLDHYAEANALMQGAPLTNFTYATVLQRALDRTRYYNHTDQYGRKTRVEVPLHELSDGTQMLYQEAQNLIRSLRVNIPVSPIDWIRSRVEAAGHRIAEITGRTLRVDYSRDVPTLSKVPSIEKRDRVATAQGFNNGGIDGLILNMAGSTGISLHASEKFRDQRTRKMYVVQPAADINEFMQMLGRINRTGQVRLPEYEMFAVALPAEVRPAMNLAKKMKSLNANTSSNTRSAVSIDAPDMMNKYGDKVVMQYLAENSDMAAKLRMEFDGDDEDTQTVDVARKATGRSALLPVAEQREFIEAITEQYKDLIDYLDSTGQNDLEPKTYDFGAREQHKEIVYKGTDPSSPFGQDAHFGMYSIKRQGKPFTPDEVKEMVREGLSSHDVPTTGALAPSAENVHRAMMKSMDAHFNAFMERQTNTFVTDRAREVRSSQMGFLMTHRIGSGSRIEINGESYNAVVTNIEPSKKAKGNPFAASSIKFSLALNGPIRGIKISGSEFQKILVTPLAAKADIQSLFYDINPDSRMKAGIITGNLLGAYGSLKGNMKPRIVSFTHEDGRKDLGMLMPAKFNPKEHISGDYCMRTAEGALKVVENHQGQGNPISAPGGDVIVVKNGRGISIKTKLAKAVGGKFYKDKNILQHIQGGEFFSRDGMMVGDVLLGHELDAIREVMNKAALYSTSSMIDRAREYDEAAKPAVKAAKPQPVPPAPSTTPKAPPTVLPAAQLDDKERTMLGHIRHTWTNSESLLHEMGENDAEFKEYNEAIARLRRKGLIEQQDNREWGTDFRRTPEGTAALKGKSIASKLLSEEGSATIPPAAEAAGQYVAKAVPATWNEITKAVRSSGKSAKKIGYEFMAAFSPSTLADTDAKDIMGHAIGEPALRMFEAAQLLRGVDKMFKGMPQEKWVEAHTRKQTGRKQASTDLQNAYDLMDRIFEQQRMRENEAMNLGRDDDDQVELSDKENYAPNRYSKPPSNDLIPSEEEQVARIGKVSRRPFGGSKAFTKKQSYTLQEAVDKGAVPLGTPVDMLMKRLQEGAKFVAARYAMHNFREQGIVTFLKNGKKMPEGYVEISDRIGKVWRPVETEKGSTVFVESGKWIIQKDAGRLLNNYLSIDHIRGTEIGNALLALKGASTAMKLGFSLFHYANIGVETMASGLQLGLDRLYNQGIRDFNPTKISAGLEDIGKSISAPVTTARLGHQMIKYVRNPDEFLASPEGERFARNYPDFPRLMGLIFHGGLRMNMGEDFRSLENERFVQAMKEGRLGSAALQIAPWIGHLVAAPLFQHYIPRVKLAFAVQMLSQKLEQYSQALAAGSITEETIAREVAATVDNRFGEFNWDSLYLNNTLRTAINLMFRAPGWQIGTWRGLSSAVSETFTNKAFDDRLFDKIDEESTNWDWAKDKSRNLPGMGLNAGWMLSKAFLVVMMGSVISKCTTGKWPWELADEAKNNFPKFANAALECLHPRVGGADDNGNPNRVNFPTDFRVFEQAAQGPAKYAKGALADWLSSSYDTWRNRDFRENYVYNPQDSAAKEFLQGLAYNFKGDFKPISTDQFQRSGDKSPAERVLAFTGMSGGKAPLLDQSQALRHALAEKKPHDPYTPEQEEAYQLAQHQPPTRFQVLRAAREKDLTYLDKVVLHDLTYTQAMEIYNKYASPAEKQQLKPVIERKRTLEILKARRGHATAK